MGPQGHELYAAVSRIGGTADSAGRNRGRWRVGGAASGPGRLPGSVAPPPTLPANPRGRPGAGRLLCALRPAGRARTRAPAGATMAAAGPLTRFAGGGNRAITRLLG